MTDITPEMVLLAYTRGWFPMARSATAEEIHWYEPEMRGVLPLDERFHVPRSLAKFLRKARYRYSVDTCFHAVLDACAAPRPKHPDTWINPQIRALYTDLHRLGHAHSIEVWRDDALVGGLYGVALGGAFFGESMFSRESGASKAALVHTAGYLRERGFTLFDAQFVNEHLRQFGMVEMPHDRFLVALREALATPVAFLP